MAGYVFDRRIGLELMEEGEDALGGLIAGYGDPFYRWADMKAVKDDEAWRAGQVESAAQARFTVRWEAQAALVTGTSRLTYDGEAWEVLGVKELGRRAYLEITAELRGRA